MENDLQIIQIIGISIGLAMDAFAVSAANGIRLHKMHVLHSLRMAFMFGLFQAVMPLLGWALGRNIAAFVEAVDHWIAFGLLSGIGIKMILDSRHSAESAKRMDIRRLPVILLLAAATSIDAFAVGFSFAMLNISIIMPVIIIGIVTFISSLAGIRLGRLFGTMFRSRAEQAGGVVLILIGVKIVVEHLFFM